MQQWGIQEYLLALFGLFGALVMWGTQVGPKQAVSHAAEWAAIFGVRNPPHWLKSENADRVIRHCGAALFVVCCLVGLFHFFNVENMGTGPKSLFWIGCAAIVGAILLSLASAPDVAPPKTDMVPPKKIDPPKKAVEKTSPTTPRPPAAPTKKTDDRNYVDAHVTPEYLVGLYQGNTALRAETLISEQLDKWMSVSGPLGEVHAGRPIFGGARSPTLAVFARQKEKEVVVYMWFSEEWMDRLSLLPKNQNISVTGRLKKVTGYNSTVELENCELVDIDPTANDPTGSSNPSMRPRRRRSSKREPS